MDSREEDSPIPTNFTVDDALVAEARRLGKHRSRGAAVNAALAEYVARRKRRSVLDLFGKLEWDPKYDHKSERKRRG